MTAEIEIENGVALMRERRRLQLEVEDRTADLEAQRQRVRSFAARLDQLETADLETDIASARQMQQELAIKLQNAQAELNQFDGVHPSDAEIERRQREAEAAEQARQYAADLAEYKQSLRISRQLMDAMIGEDANRKELYDKIQRRWGHSRPGVPLLDFFNGPTPYPWLKETWIRSVLKKFDPNLLNDPES